MARSPVRNRTVRAAQVWKLRPPEGTTLRRLPIELHAPSRSRGRQVTILPLGLHRDDVGQERSWPVGLLLDTEVRAPEVHVQAGGRRNRPERVVDGELLYLSLLGQSPAYEEPALFRGLQAGLDQRGRVRAGFGVVWVADHPVPGSPTEELVDRNAQRLALDVPQRYVHGRDRGRNCVPGGEEAPSEEQLPKVLGTKGILLEEDPWTLAV